MGKWAAGTEFEEGRPATVRSPLLGENPLREYRKRSGMGFLVSKWALLGNWVHRRGEVEESVDLSDSLANLPAAPIQQAEGE